MRHLGSFDKVDGQSGPRHVEALIKLIENVVEGVAKEACIKLRDSELQTWRITEDWVLR